MRNTSAGSVLIVVMLTCALIVVWATTVWRHIASMNDVALAKQQYEQQFRLTEALLEYGITAAKSWHEQWRKNAAGEHKATCRFAHWPPEKKKESLCDSYAGLLTLEQHDKEITIHAQLLKQDNVIFGLNAVMSEQKSSREKDSGEDAPEPILVLQKWAFDER